MSDEKQKASPLAATLASILVPGAGYLLLGQRKRAIIAGGGVILLFALGVFIAGVRVMTVPGFDNDGHVKYVEYRSPEGRVRQPLLLVAPLSVLGDNLSFLGQMFAGPLCVVEGWASVTAAQQLDPQTHLPTIPKSYSRLADVGSLYTAVAGMLNLMVIVDTYARASRKERE